MGKVYVIRKDNGSPTMGMTMQSGGGGLSPSILIGQGGEMDPSSEEFATQFGAKGSPSHDRAVRMQNFGRNMRYGLGAYGALTSAYNQMASGEPGIGRAIGSGAMSGYYGSSGLEDLAARLGQKFGRKLSQDDPNPRQMRLDNPLYHQQRPAEPTQNPDPQQKRIDDPSFTQQMDAAATEAFAPAPETESQRQDRLGLEYFG